MEPRPQDGATPRATLRSVLLLSVPPLTMSHPKGKFSHVWEKSSHTRFLFLFGENSTGRKSYQRAGKWLHQRFENDWGAICLRRCPFLGSVFLPVLPPRDCVLSSGHLKATTAFQWIYGNHLPWNRKENGNTRTSCPSQRTVPSCVFHCFSRIPEATNVCERNFTGLGHWCPSHHCMRHCHGNVGECGYDSHRENSQNQDTAAQKIPSPTFGLLWNLLRAHSYTTPNLPRSTQLSQKTTLAGKLQILRWDDSQWKIWHFLKAH